jgi:hypothetical protein
VVRPWASLDSFGVDRFIVILREKYLHVSCRTCKCRLVRQFVATSEYDHLLSVDYNSMSLPRCRFVSDGSDFLQSLLVDLERINGIRASEVFTGTPEDDKLVLEADYGGAVEFEFFGVSLEETPLVLGV